MTGGIFGDSSSSSATTSAFTGFGRPTTTTTCFGQPTTTAATTSAFGQPTTTAAFTGFGHPTATTTGRFFGQPTTTAGCGGFLGNDVTPSYFGPFFGTTPTVRIGGSATIASLGRLTSPPFGQTTTTNFGQTSSPATTGGLFGGVKPTTTGGLLGGVRPTTTATGFEFETRPCTTIPCNSGFFQPTPTSCFGSNQTGLGICGTAQPLSAALQSPIGTRLNGPFKPQQPHNQLTNEIILRITPFIENFTLDCHNVPSSCTINIKLNMDTGKIFSIEYEKEKNNSDQQDLLKQLKAISSQLDLIKFDLKNKDQNSTAKINQRANEI